MYSNLQNYFYGKKEFTGRVKQISFDTGRVDIGDKAKTIIYCPFSLLSTLTFLVLNNPYVHFLLDGKIICSCKECESQYSKTKEDAK